MKTWFCDNFIPCFTFFTGVKCIECLPCFRQEQAEDARVSLDEIKKMADIAHRDGARDREALREWMATKRSKQMEEYKRHLEELREREPRPFRPAHENFDQVRFVSIEV
ncbi:hypothetical protein DPMN_157274 [Dreissena polymorpha]|uniref:Uncharacterized protein n=1 Tax=Dreissena polymorpha TaxID=45954 RepID=A0A9D4EJ17_DREPO|nr:hypothetical protein DPMN_157274 [Dreissena polymorpha]